MKDSLKSTKKWIIIKNVGVLSLSFMFYFIAYNGTTDLQNYDVAEVDLDIALLTSECAGNLLSCIFLSAVLIEWFGTKWTMLWSIVAYVPHIACQMYPSFYTLVPAAFLLGLGSGPLWCAKCTYLSVAADAHSILSKEPAEMLLQRFFGCFSMFYQISQFWGHLVSSLIHSTGNTTSETSVDETMIPELCGASFEGMTDQESQPILLSERNKQTLTGIYLGLIFVSVFTMAVGVDSLKRSKPRRASNSEKLSRIAPLIITLKQFVEPNQLLLIPNYIFIGFQQTFVVTDFTSSFVSCGIGSASVNHVMMAFGLSDAAGCFFSGYLAKLFGNLTFIICTLFIHMTILVSLILWSPQTTDYYIVFIIAVLWGFCDSVWQVQTIAYCGLIFHGKEEAAFSILGLWQQVGIVIMYITSSHTTTRYKIVLLLCSLILGILGYFKVEYRYRINRKTNKNIVKEALDNISF